MYLISNLGSGCCHMLLGEAEGGRVGGMGTLCDLSYQLQQEFQVWAQCLAGLGVCSSFCFSSAEEHKLSHGCPTSDNRH